MAKTISDVKAQFQKQPIERWPALMKEYAGDQRAGVQAVIRSCQNRVRAYENERQRLLLMREFENRYSHCEWICGIDEAGRGPLAGPVTAGAVILPKDIQILYLNDSKKLSAGKRAALFEEIKEKALFYGIGMVSPGRIDQINILQATYEAMIHAVEDLEVVPDLLLNDAVTIPDLPIRQIGIVKGDTKSVSIAAASIIAKVTRDRLMEEYAELYPEYGFEKHKGYGSAAHIAALREFGPCPIHRLTFLKNIRYQ